jgi:hypothetical protein
VTTAVALTRALERATDRTAALLWRPFDGRTWIVLAFAQFLASLPPSFWGGGGGSLRDSDWSRAGEEIETAWERLLAAGALLALVAVGLVLLLAVVVALLWVGSRAKFVFLDDVIHRRARIVEPWNRFSREGNSLFLCTLALFFVACGVAIVSVLSVVSTIGLAAIRMGEARTIWLLVIVGSLAGLFFVTLAYVAFYLQAFVVPLMHRYRIGALQAWRRFYGLWSASPIPFLVVGLVVIAGFVAFTISAILFGFMTCCFGFLLLMAPYLSNLLLLPLTVFYRAFTFEFLAQFDGELLAPQES